MNGMPFTDPAYLHRRAQADAAVPSGPPETLEAFVINLEAAADRLAHMQAMLAGTRFPMVRVPAVNGRALSFPIPEYAEGLYRWFHGRKSNPGEVGCYLSHVAAFALFLERGGPHALICEDDITLGPNFEEVVRAALASSSDWDILRLSGLGLRRGISLGELPHGHELCVNLHRIKGTGAYLINRLAAQRLVTGLLPMRLPYDHALDREWFFGLRALAVFPFPASQTDTAFRSSIQAGKARKLGWRHRFFTTYPYQALHEISRYLARGWQLVRARLRRG